MIELRDHKDKEELLQQLAGFFNKQAGRERTLKKKAKERRDKSKAEDEDSDGRGRGEKSRHSHGGPDTQHSAAVSLDRQERLFVAAELEGQKSWFLVDCGSEISILSEATWNRLPDRIRARAEDPENGTKTVTGVGGEAGVLATIELRIEVEGIATLERFWVVPGYASDLVGLTWFASTQAVFSHPERCLWLGTEKPVQAPLFPVRAQLGCYAVQTAVESHEESEVIKQIDPDLSQKEKQRIQQILVRWKAAWGQTELGKCTVIEHTIDTEGAAPRAEKPRKMSPQKQQEAQRQIQELLEAGAIERSSSAWAAPIVFIQKKGGEWRMCIDYRKLNEVTKKDSYPFPLIEDLGGRT